MGAVLAWLLKVSIATIKWSVANPLKAVVVALTLKVSSDYVRKQPWAGATLLADMLYGGSQLYAWPAGVSLGLSAGRSTGKAALGYIVRLLAGWRSNPLPQLKTPTLGWPPMYVPGIQ